MASGKKGAPPVVQPEKPPEPEIPPPSPKYGDKWLEDPIDGDRAFRLSMNLHQRIEEKAAPVRTWLEENIVGLLLPALNALVAFRPSNPHEFLAAHLIKNNPTKDRFPEDEPKPRKPIEEEIEPDDEDDACGCNRFKKKEPPPPEEEPEQVHKHEEVAKKGSIAPKASVAPAGSLLAKSRAGSAVK